MGGFGLRIVYGQAGSKGMVAEAWVSGAIIRHEVL